MVVADLLVRIGVDLKDLEGGLAKGAGVVDSFGASITAAGERATAAGSAMSVGLTAPILAVGAGLVAASLNVGAFADELLDLVDQTGLSSTKLQEFAHVATVAGVDSDTLAQAAIKLTTALSGGGDDTLQLRDAMGALGISTRDVNDNLIPMDKLLPDIIGALQETEDVTTRNALAGDIFGRSWADLAPILALGAEGFAAASAEAHELGLVLSEEALTSADAFRLQVDNLKASTSAAALQLGVAFLPILTQLATFLQTTAVPAIVAVVGMFDAVPEPVLLGAAAVAGLVAAIGPLLLAFGTAVQLLPVLTAGFAVLTGPVGLATAAIAALVVGGVALVANWDKIETATSKAWKAITGLVERSVDAIADKFDWFLGPVGDLIASVAGLVTEVGGLFGDLAMVGITKVTELGTAVVRQLVDNLAPLARWMSERIFAPVIAGFDALKTNVVRLAALLFEGVREWLVNKFTAIVDGIKAHLDRVTEFFAGLRETLVGNSIVVDMVTEIGGEFTRMGGLMETETESGVSATVTKFSGLTGALTGIVGAEATGVLGKLGDFKGDVVPAIGGVLDAIKGKWDTVKSIITTPLAEGIAGALGEWSTFAEGFIGIISGIWNRIGKFIDKLIEFVDKIGASPFTFPGVGGFPPPHDVTFGSNVPTLAFAGSERTEVLLTDILFAIEEKEWSPTIVVNVQGGGGGGGLTSLGSGSGEWIDEELERVRQRRAQVGAGDMSLATP